MAVNRAVFSSWDFPVSSSLTCSKTTNVEASSTEESLEGYQYEIKRNISSAQGTSNFNWHPSNCKIFKQQTIVYLSLPDSNMSQRATTGFSIYTSKRIFVGFIRIFRAFTDNTAVPAL